MATEPQGLQTLVSQAKIFLLVVVFGDLELAKKLIAAAADAGCDAVKFQKRTVEKPNYLFQ